MTDFIFNNAKGRVVTYANLPAANDAWIAVPIEASGLEADATLRDYTNLSLLLAGTSNEQATMGRKTLSGLTSTVDNTKDITDVDAIDLLWPIAGGNPIAAVLLCYVPDTTAPSDTTVIPVIKLDFIASPNGGDLTYQFPAADAGGGPGFYRT